MKNLFVLIFLALTSAAFSQTPTYVNTTTSGTSDSIPLNSTNNNKVQWLLKNGSFSGIAPGLINKIYIKSASAISSATLSNLTIKIGTTTQTTLTPGVWISSGMNTVFYAASKTITGIPANGWIPIILTTPFYYDTANKLIIELSVTNKPGISLLKWKPTGIGNKRMFGKSTSGAASIADTNLAIIGIDLLKPDFISTTQTGSAGSLVFNNTTYNRAQWLYTPGQFTNAPAGQVTTIWVKAGSATGTVTYTDFTVKLGYTTLTALSTGPYVSSNMVTYVYEASKTLNGVVANQWIPITLQKPFFYDPTKYLILEISQTTMTGTGINCFAYNPNTGNKRIYGTPTLGTFTDGSQIITGISMISPITTDAGVYTINRPSNPNAPGLDTVKCSFLNYGNDTLKSVGFGWSVNGVVKTSPSNWSGSLPKFNISSSITMGAHNFTTGTNTVKVWTKTPNSKTDSFAANDTLVSVFTTCSPFNGTYIIDVNGTGNFTSINAAISQMMQCGVTGPTVFRIKPGSYYEQIRITTIPGVSATNTVTFEAFNGDSTSVVINYKRTPPPGQTADNFVIQFVLAKHLIFKKLTIKSYAQNYGRVLDFADKSDSITFQSCNLWINPDQPYWNSNTGDAMAVVYSASNTANNKITFKNNNITGGWHAFWFVGTSTTVLESNNVFEGNVITGFQNYGIYVTNQSGVIIRNNYIQPYKACYGQPWSIYTTYCNNNSIISSNKVIINSPISASTAAYGIYCATNAGTSTLPGEISNNMITINMGTAATGLYGIYLSGCSYQNIYNNSVSINTALASGTNSAAFYQTGGTTPVNLYNNIFSNTGNGYAIYIGTTTAVNKCDYNDLYTSGASIGYWTSARTDLAAWRTATLKDSSSVSLNPAFYSTTDLHINTTGLDGKGKFLAGITTDIDGQNRSNPPDIGADEFTLIYSDAGISLLVTDAVCAGNNNLVVKVKNFGLAMLNNVTVNWSVNGITQTPVSASPAIGTYQESNVTMGSYSFASTGTYNIKIWTTSPNSVTDSNKTNDTLRITGFKTAMSGDYTIGATSADFTTINLALNELKSRGVCGLTRLRIYPGMYTEQLNIPYIKGTSSANRVVFESFNLDSSSVTIGYAGVYLGDGYILQLMGADYITINKLSFKGLAQYIKCIDIGGGSDYCRITNNVLSTTLAASDWSTAIFSTNTFDNYNLIENNLILGSSNGIKLQGNNNTTLYERGNVIRNNTIIGSANGGVFMTYQRSPRIENNKINFTPNSTSSSLTGVSLSDALDTIRITGNKTISTAPSPYTIYPLYIQNCTGTASLPALVANNTGASDAATTPQWPYGIVCGSSSYINFYHNSFNFPSVQNGRCAMISGSTATVGLRFFNNSFLINGTGTTVRGYEISPGPLLSAITSDYNNFKITGASAVLARFSTSFTTYTDYSTLVAWQTGTAKDSHSVVVNPNYYSSTDLHSSSPYLNGAGLKFNTVTTDMDGETRHATTPDIGADEFDMVARDAAVIALLNPTAVCDGVNDSIVVKIRNMGTDTIKSVKLKWSVNNVMQSGKTFTVNLPNSRDTNLVLGYKTFSFGINYNMKIWADTVNSLPDLNHKNDTLNRKNFKTGLKGIYTIGSGKNYSSFTAAVNDLKAYGICESVTFRVDPGTYQEQILIPAIMGSSPSDSITFTPANGDSNSVILQYASTSATDNYVITLSGADYIRFEKMTIRSVSVNNGTLYCAVIVMANGSDHNVFANNKILSRKYEQGNSSYIIEIKQGTNQFNTFTNNLVRNGYFGINTPTSGTQYSKGNTVQYNRFDSIYSTSLYMTYQDSLLIDHNYFAQTYLGVRVDYSKNDCRITNNIIYGQSYGLMATYLMGTATQRPLIANNLINATSSTAIGLYLSAGKYVKVYHNTITANGTATNPAYAMSYCLDANIYDNPNASRYGYIDMQNNIIVQLGTAFLMNIDAISLSNNYIALSDYNTFYTGGLFSTNNTIVDLSSWKGNSGKDYNSISKLPVFKSATDFHLADVNGMNAANYLPEVPNDIDGDQRDVNLPIMGADERGKVSLDAGIYGFTEPTATVCEGSAPFTVRLMNYGLTRIDSVSIIWQVGSVNKTPVLVKCNLSPGKDTLVLLGYHNLSLGSKYEALAYTQWPNNDTDRYTGNDYKYHYVNSVQALPVAPTVVNDTICKGTVAELSAGGSNYKHLYWFDTAQGGTIIFTDSAFTTPVLQASKTYYVEARAPGAPTAFNTKAQVGPMEMGNMFTIISHNKYFMIDSLGLFAKNIPGGTYIPMACFYKTGGYKGYEQDSASWTFLGYDTVFVDTGAKYAPIHISQKLFIRPTDTLSFYVTTTDINTVICHNEVKSEISDSNLIFIAGTKNFYPFSTYDTNKTWSGMIYYSTGELCNSQRVAVEAVVNKIPDVQLLNDTSVCSGAIFNPDAGSGPGFSYQWKNGADPTVISTNQILTVDTTGQYIVLVDDTCGFNDVDTFNLSVYPRARVNFSINDTTQCQSGNNFGFANAATLVFGNIAGYHWNFGDGVQNSDTNTTHSYTTADTFTVLLHATTDFGCVDSHMVDLVVFPQPAAAFTINDTNQCFRGHNFVFTNNSTVSSGNLVMYNWSFGDTATNNDTNTSHIYSAVDTFDVKLWVISDNGCDDSSIVQVVVNLMPVAGFTVNDTSQCLIGNSFVFANSSTIPSGTLSYSWKAGDGGTAVTSNYTYAYTKAGTYSPVLIAESGFGCQDSVSAKVYVIANPFVDLGKDTTIKNPKNLVLNAGSGFDSIVWSNGAKTKTITIDSAGWNGLGVKNISVTVYKNGCPYTDNIAVTIISSVGIDNIGAELDLSVFPNPVSSELNIVFNGSKGKASIVITDLLGNVVITNNLQLNGKTAYQVDMSQLPYGTYLLKVVNEDKVYVKKIVRE